MERANAVERQVVNLIPVTSEGKIILAYKNAVESNPGLWLPLGGTRIETEGDIDCLRRKLEEEIKLSPEKLREILGNMEYLNQFSGKAPENEAIVMAQAYVVRVSCILSPNTGVEKLDTFSYSECMSEPLVSETTKHMIKVLKELSLLK